VPGRGLERLDFDRGESVHDGTLTLKLSLSLPSVSLIELFQPRSQ